jgi:hypothetical protein
MYDYLMLCQADKYHQQQLDAQQEYEDALGARFMKLAEKFSYMANHVPQLRIHLGTAGVYREHD